MKKKSRLNSKKCKNDDGMECRVNGQNGHYRNFSLNEMCVTFLIRDFFLEIVVGMLFRISFVARIGFQVVAVPALGLDLNLTNIQILICT